MARVPQGPHYTGLCGLSVADRPCWCWSQCRALWPPQPWLSWRLCIVRGDGKIQAHFSSSAPWHVPSRCLCLVAHPTRSVPVGPFLGTAREVGVWSLQADHLLICMSSVLSDMLRSETTPLTAKAGSLSAQCMGQILWEAEELLVSHRGTSDQTMLTPSPGVAEAFLWAPPLTSPILPRSLHEHCHPICKWP